MARRGNKNKNKTNYNPLNGDYNSRQLQLEYYDHYFNYLRQLAYQLFEWENLPSSVNPRFLEMSLHNFGYCALYDDPMMGWIATRGTINSMLDIYEMPKAFQANMISYHRAFPLYNYVDERKPNMGILCSNNDLFSPSLPVIGMFANDLAEIKNIIRINQNAQKTPVVLKANKSNMLSMKAMFNQVDGNAPVILTDETFDLDAIKAISLSAPVVFPQLNDQKNNVWNEFMTWIGIDNTNLMKKERMVTDEVNGNQDQVKNSANIMLKSRQEFCKKANEYDPSLNISVKLRAETLDLIQQNIKEDKTNGEVHGKSV